MTFLGKYEHNLDDKSRLTIPSKIRNKLGQIVIISKGFDGCLEMRTPEAFEIWSNEITNYSNASANTRLMAREIFANSSDVEVDNSGRIKITSNLLDLAGINKAVLILGLYDKIEIWDPIKYQEYCDKNLGSLEVVAEKLGGAF